MQASMASMCTYPAAALWDEVAGIHVDQFAQVLRSLKLATSYWISLPSNEQARGAQTLWHGSCSLEKRALNQGLAP